MKDIRLQNLASQNWSNAKLRGATFQCNLTEKMILRGADLRELKAHATSFTTVNFDRANLSNASDITGGLFHGCSMRNVNLSGANLAGTLFYQCDLTGANFSNAQLRGAVFNECQLSKTTWRNANLESCGFSVCQLGAADFRDADAGGVQFRARCRMTGADFDKANLANSVFHDCAGERLDFSRSILTGAIFNGVDFSQSRLTGALADDLSILKSSFKGAVFSVAAKGIFRARSLTIRDSNLQRARFDSAYLYRAHITGDFFSQMVLTGASFKNATLINSYFAADLRGADFDRATAEYAHFVQCDCRRASFRGTRFRGATLVKGSFSQNTFKPLAWPAWMDRCQGVTAPVKGRKP